MERNIVTTRGILRLILRPPMKIMPRPFIMLMWIASTMCLAAKDQDYHAKMTALFEQSASCLIEGDFSWQDVICDVNHVANSKEKLGKIKKCFLSVNAKYLGLDNFDRPPSMYSSYLHITWKDTHDKVTAEMSLLNGKQLIFSDKTMYQTPNVTLLFSLVAAANPEAFAKKPSSQ